MSHTLIKNCFIYKIKEFEENDAIINCFHHAKKLTFLAKGFQKTESKNRINLNIFSFVNLEIFLASKKNKISRLKKSTTEKQLNFLNKSVSSFFQTLKKIFFSVDKILNFDALNYDLMSELKNFYQSLLEIYQEMQFDQKNFDFFESYLCFNYLKIINNFSTFSCKKCNSTKITSFSLEEGGFLCKIHSQKIFLWEFLHALFFLNINLKTYTKKVNVKTNKEILTFLKKEINKNYFF